MTLLASNTRNKPQKLEKHMNCNVSIGICMCCIGAAILDLTTLKVVSRLCFHENCKKRKTDID